MGILKRRIRGGEKRRQGEKREGRKEEQRGERREEDNEESRHRTCMEKVEEGMIHIKRRIWIRK